jgi:hypothetical protein
MMDIVLLGGGGSGPLHEGMPVDPRPTKVPALRVQPFRRGSNQRLSIRARRGNLAGLCEDELGLQHVRKMRHVEIAPYSLAGSTDDTACHPTILQRTGRTLTSHTATDVTEQPHRQNVQPPPC